MNGQWMKSYMLNVYIIHVECADIVMNHHLWLNVGCNFTYVINGIQLHVLICNFFIVVNYNCKLTFFFNDTSTFVVVKHHLEVIHIVSQFYVLSRIFRNRNTCFNGYLIKYHRAVKNNSCYNNNMFSIKAYFKGLNSTQYVLYKMQRICFNACKNVEYQMIKKKKKYYNN